MNPGRIRNSSRRRCLVVQWAESGVDWEVPIMRQLPVEQGRRARRLAGCWVAGRLQCGNHGLWVSVPDRLHSGVTRGPGRIDLNWL